MKRRNLEMIGERELSIVFPSQVFPIQYTIPRLCDVLAPWLESVGSQIDSTSLASRRFSSMSVSKPFISQSSQPIQNRSL